MVGSMQYEWGHPDDEGVGYNSREGGYLGATIYEGWDFARDILSIEAEIENDALIDDISDALSDSSWCKVDPYALSQNEELYFNWKLFSEQVKHETRYVFFKTSSEIDSNGLLLNPYEILDFIGENIEKLGLIKFVSKLTIYRARVSNKGEYFYTAKEVGTPPKEYALTSNRMSPAGIPMFYGAIDEETALTEVGYKKGVNVVASLGKFINTSNLILIDLTSLPDAPSIFDEDNQKKRWIIKFFRSFLKDFVKPVEKDGAEHIDYVPTQIVTEYLRHLYRTSNKQQINGIVYNSSKNGRKAYVLFFENQDCTDAEDLKGKLLLSRVYHKS
ncbi:hypothetical protein J1TS3_45290 [Siminovitchia fordii]|uniref:RES domain-containing protein n=2 Tax=Siminovitchia fordii TaxID=254759 RepID=A0ABQ4KCD6_9BACI|nr:hypothetical protein J1TS3_45290 [Siminovitchia fordii]